MTTDVVQAVFDATPKEARGGMLALRGMIFDVARETLDGALLREELRWGQPAYLAPKGSTLRIGAPQNGGFALYAHCQTSLIQEFDLIQDGRYKTEGNRAILFEQGTALAQEVLAPFIARALTYHEGAKRDGRKA